MSQKWIIIQNNTQKTSQFSLEKLHRMGKTVTILRALPPPRHPRTENPSPKKPRHSPTASLTSPHPKGPKMRRNDWPTTMPLGFSPTKKNTQKQLSTKRRCFLECLGYYIMIEKWKAFLDFEEFLACVGNQPILFLGCHLDLFLPGGFLWMLFFLPEDTSEKIRASRSSLVMWGTQFQHGETLHDFGTIDMIANYHTKKNQPWKKTSMFCFLSDLFTINHTATPNPHPSPFCPKPSSTKESGLQLTYTIRDLSR